MVGQKKSVILELTFELVRLSIVPPLVVLGCVIGILLGKASSFSPRLLVEVIDPSLGPSYCDPDCMLKLLSWPEFTDADVGGESCGVLR